jgi:very-short-patch-repair endonuclease
MKHTPARDPEAIEFARGPAPRQVDSRETVWQWVESRQVCRQKFRREYPLPPYTADFYCVELKLILEVDGADHFTEEAREPRTCRKAVSRWRISADFGFFQTA